MSLEEGRLHTLGGGEESSFNAATASTAVLAARRLLRSYREPAGRRGILSPERVQLGAALGSR